MNLADFDSYDQTLLAAALKDGRQYAKVADGPEGWWVTSVYREDPVHTIDRSEHRYAKILRLDEIAGLAESAFTPRG